MRHKRRRNVQVYRNHEAARTGTTTGSGKNKVEIHVRGNSAGASRTVAGANNIFTYGTPSTVISQQPNGAYSGCSGPAVRLTGKSRFNGCVAGLVGLILLVYFVTIVTLGLGTPWMICAEQRWIARHTQLDGLQVVFEGKGKDLFWRYIGWLLLTIITFGIYGLWMSIKMQAWITENTHLDG